MILLVDVHVMTFILRMLNFRPLRSHLSFNYTPTGYHLYTDRLAFIHRQVIVYTPTGVNDRQTIDGCLYHLTEEKEIWA